MLVEKAIYVISYDFIKSKLTGYKRIALEDLKKVKFGLLKYPKNSMMGYRLFIFLLYNFFLNFYQREYKYGAIKISWDNEDNLSFFQKWNPLAEIPFTTFTSHHILYNEKEHETSIYNCDEFIASLEYGIRIRLILSKLIKL